MMRVNGISRVNSGRVALALLSVLLLATGSCATAQKKPEKSTEPASVLSDEYADLLRVHRPDLAERWSRPIPEEVLFVPLSAETIPAHERALRALLDRAVSLPASPVADSLRARLAYEIAQTATGGALRTDPLLWLEIVASAARAPFAWDTTAGCREVGRAVPQLERIPEALRGAAVMMRGLPAPDASAFEMAVARAEEVFRRELPRRARGCREGRLVGQFVEADSTAAASLASFRRLLYPAP